MKTFKEFIKDFENAEISMTYTDKLVAYAAYCQGYIEGIGHERRMPVVMPSIPNYPLPEEATRITCNTPPLGIPAYIDDLNAQYERDKKDQGSGRV